MPWMTKGRGDVTRAWAAALEQVLEAVDPTGQVAGFVLTGQDAQALTAIKGGNLWVQRVGRRNSDATNTASRIPHSGTFVVGCFFAQEVGVGHGSPPGPLVSNGSVGPWSGYSSRSIGASSERGAR